MAAAHNVALWRKQANALRWVVAEAPGWWLDAACGCGRTNLLSLQVVAERLPAGGTLAMLVARLRCSGCGDPPVRAVLQNRKSGASTRLLLLPTTFGRAQDIR